MHGKLYALALASSVIGLLVSVYLLLYHTLSLPLVCPSTGIINCGSLLSSTYAYFLGIPMEVYGILFFSAELLLLHLRKKEVLLFLNAIGIGVVIYLIYLENLVGKICPYCTAVHIIVVVLFLLSLYDLKERHYP